MKCPKCGIELRVSRRTEAGEILLVCKNPKCESCRKGETVAVLK